MGERERVGVWVCEIERSKEKERMRKEEKEKQMAEREKWSSYLLLVQTHLHLSRYCQLSHLCKNKGKNLQKQETPTQVSTQIGNSKNKPVNETVGMEILQTLEYPLQDCCYGDLLQDSALGVALGNDVFDNVQQ